jgi:hypothetical protein
MKIESLLEKLEMHRESLKTYRKAENEARAKANFQHKRIEIILDILFKKLKID